MNFFSIHAERWLNANRQQFTDIPFFVKHFAVVEIITTASLILYHVNVLLSFLSGWKHCAEDVLQDIQLILTIEKIV